MMVPEFSLIGEIMLYACGYLHARELARKLVATCRYAVVCVAAHHHQGPTTLPSTIDAAPPTAPHVYACMHPRQCCMQAVQ
jgi:Hydrolytic ATP binding site of dynein motor region